MEINNGLQSPSAHIPSLEYLRWHGFAALWSKVLEIVLRAHIYLKSSFLGLRRIPISIFEIAFHGLMRYAPGVRVGAQILMAPVTPVQACCHIRAVIQIRFLSLGLPTGLSPILSISGRLHTLRP